MDNRREQIINFVNKEFIGPDPIDYPGLQQDNGEEILSSDPPRIRYIAGILFPKKTKLDDIIEDSIDEDDAASDDPETSDENSHDEEKKVDTSFTEEVEELINLSNSYRQSAISMTVATSERDTIGIAVKYGIYKTVKEFDEKHGKDRTKYYRKQIKWDNDNEPLDLPSNDRDAKRYWITVDGEETQLRLSIFRRFSQGESVFYTFSLENTYGSTTNTIRNEECFFQVSFSVVSEKGFVKVPLNEKPLNQDEDFLSNQLLYRKVNNYAIGHGCATDWIEDSDGVRTISTSFFPEYEIKPIVPAQIEGITLDMYHFSDYGNFGEAIEELDSLCIKYKSWIDSLQEEAAELEEQFRQTATRHIAQCLACHKRMVEGVVLLKSNDRVRKAFQYMNRAMLMQQLHYKLPLQNWIEDEGKLILNDIIKQIPDVNDRETWYGNKDYYGKWRPFQIAFIMINLNSMANPLHQDRKIVDLIWFPTGGGKTEAYLGLSAYSIFLRRLYNKEDSGTSIIMRYTLRLLTSQQYERAASMICACDVIRNQKIDELGSTRISIGLWVGSSSTPNTRDTAVKTYSDLYSGRSTENPFVLLKCPWCGAQMGIVKKKNGTISTPGYYKKRGNNRTIVFRCNNKKHNCHFSHEGQELPLYVIDEDIYEYTPTLLLGTVDKFAILPYKPESQRLFGWKDGKPTTGPDLIIQDELHLISGPLGSMVGHYETMINELTSHNSDESRISPKVIASTATISHSKEQCHALYACGKDNVVQFPPVGLDAGDSFFAKE